MPFNTPNQYLDLIDNVSLDEGIVGVPEPASSLLLSLGGIALIRPKR